MIQWRGLSGIWPPIADDLPRLFNFRLLERLVSTDLLPATIWWRREGGKEREGRRGEGEGEREEGERERGSPCTLYSVVCDIKSI